MMVSVLLAESSYHNDDDFVLVDHAPKASTYDAADIFSLREVKEGDCDDISSASSFDYCDDFLSERERNPINTGINSPTRNDLDVRLSDENINLSTSCFLFDNDFSINGRVGDNEQYVDKQLAILADELSSLMSDGVQGTVTASTSSAKSSSETENCDTANSGSLYSSSSLAPATAGSETIVPSCDDISADWPFVMDKNIITNDNNLVTGSSIDSVSNSRSRISNKKKRKQLKVNKKKAAATAALAHFATNIHRNSTNHTVSLPSTLNVNRNGTKSNFASSCSHHR